MGLPSSPKKASSESFWRPRASYVIAISAAAAPKAASPNDGARPPPGMHSYEVVVRRARESEPRI